MSDKEVSPEKKDLKGAAAVSDDDEEDLNIEQELALLQKAKKDEGGSTLESKQEISAITDEVVKKDYHESVINDVYNSMSDSEEEDEELSQQQLQE